MWSIVADGVACLAVAVGLSVCYNCEPCKNGWTDWHVVWDDEWCGLSVPRITRGFRSPYAKGNFEGEKGWPIV